MVQTDVQSFFEIQKKLEIIPFNQTKEWMEHSYGSRLGNIIFLVDSETEPTIACIGRVSKPKLVGKTLSIDGVCKSKALTIRQTTQFFKAIVELGFESINVSDIDEYDPNFEVGMRRSGLIRPLGLHLCPMSMIVDLQQPFNFHRNWRRSVKKATEQGCKVIIKERPTIKDAGEFVRLFNELKERKSLGFSLSDETIMTLLQGDYQLFFVENKEGRNISGRIVYYNGNLVYDVYAANSDEAISVGAAYLIQEYILRYFEEKGYEKFDYGRISPSADEMDNIYVAKSYSGGRPIGYNGEWEFFKKQWKKYYNSFYRFVYGHGRMY